MKERIHDEIPTVKEDGGTGASEETWVHIVPPQSILS